MNAAQILREALKEAEDCSVEFIVKFRNQNSKLKIEADKLREEVKEMSEKCTKSDEANRKIIDQLKQYEEKLRQSEKVKQDIKELEDELNASRSTAADLQRSNAGLQKKCSDLEETEERWRKNAILRKPMIVCCRIRPAGKNGKGVDLPGLKYSDSHVELKGEDESISRFNYDGVFGKDANNDQIYHSVDHLFDSAMKGKYVFIFAYGVTGSGKTTTMLKGIGDDSSLLERSLAKVFKNRGVDEGAWTVQARCVEAKAEKYFDIAFHKAPTSGTTTKPKPAESQNERELTFPIDENRKNDGLTFPYKIKDGEKNSLQPTTLKSMDDVDELLSRIKRQRSSDATEQNKNSSRGHAWIELRLFCNEDERGVVTFVDLAGLEDVPKDKDRRTESSTISKEMEELRKAIAETTRANWSTKWERDRSRVHKFLAILEKDLTGKTRYGRPLLLVLGHIHGADSRNRKTLQWLNDLQNEVPKRKAKKPAT